MRLFRRRLPSRPALALLPEPDYTGSYIADLAIGVIEVSPDGVVIQIRAEDASGPICLIERTLKPGMEWPFTFRVTKEHEAP